MHENRRIRVFVSSTFRDMVKERDELMTHTWPELRRMCRERQVELVEVDLRWGIAEEQATRQETLKFCLDEIKACRPFFIALLGERYGWTPGPEAFTADLKEEQAWLGSLAGKSVTELEILHGVLNNPEMAGRAFFYFRDPAYAQGRGSDFLPEDETAAQKQSDLKRRIRLACAEKKIPLRENFADPHALAALVFDDLKLAIAAQFPIEQIPDPLSRDARDHESFAETRRRTYIGRREYFARLDAHAADNGEPLVLLGESGSGKSALLANWIEHYRAEHSGDFIFQHYIGGTPDSTDHYRLMARFIAEIKLWSGDSDELPRTHDELKRDFGLWLAKARARAEHLGVRVIVVLDALNQLEDQDHAQLLGWLPDFSLSGALRLVVSTLPGEAFDAVNKRGWETITVGPLTTNERRGMIEHYLARFGKKLDAPRLERIASVPAAANPLFLKTLLDELRVTGTHHQLDARLDTYLAAPDIPTLLSRVLERWQRDYERDRPSLVGESLCLIWAARRGLTEPELLHLLRQADLPQLPAAIWSPFRAALDESLIDRGGILNFAHDFLRAAVERAFLSDQDSLKNLRLRLADEFDQQRISARSCDELPWLLSQIREYDRLQVCLLDLTRFSEIHERDSNQLMRYWQLILSNGNKKIGASLDIGRLYRDQLERIPFQEKIYVVGTLGQFLYELGFFDAALQCFEDQDKVILDLDAPKTAEVFAPIFLTAVTANDKGLIERDSGRPENALRLFKEAVRMVDSYSSHLSNVKEKLDAKKLLATLLMNQVSIIRSDADRTQCDALLEKALALMKDAYGEQSPEVATVLQGIGSFNAEHGEFDNALRFHTDALTIRRRALGGDHRDVGLSLGNLANSFSGLHHYHFAMEFWERALQILTNTVGDQHQLSKNVSIMLAQCKELADHSMATRSGFGIVLLACQTQWPKENPPDPSSPDGASLVAKSISNLLIEVWDDCVAVGSSIPVLLVACPSYEEAVAQALQTSVARRFPREMLTVVTVPSIQNGKDPVLVMASLPPVAQQFAEWLGERNLDVVMVRPIANSGATTERRLLNFVKNSCGQKPVGDVSVSFKREKSPLQDFRPIAIEAVPWDEFDGPLLGLYTGDADPRPCALPTPELKKQGYSPVESDLRASGVVYVNVPAVQLWLKLRGAKVPSPLDEWSFRTLLSMATEPISEQCSAFESSLSDLILLIKTRPINFSHERGIRALALKGLNEEIEALLN